MRYFALAVFCLLISGGVYAQNMVGTGITGDARGAFTPPFLVVQDGTVNVTSGVATAPSATVASVPIGSRVVLALSGVGTTINMVTDSAGNSYSLVLRSNTNFDIEIWSAANIANALTANSDTFTATTAAGGVSQYSLNAGAAIKGYNGAVDVTGSAHSAGNVLTLTVPASGATTNSPDMAFAAINGLGGTGYVEDPNWNELVTGSVNANNPLAWRWLPTVGVTPSWMPTLNTTGGSTVDGVLVTFKNG
jgi:hypothetical protein